MFSLKEPSEAAIQGFISSQESLPFSYEAVGATREDAVPSRYVVDRYRMRLGEGPEAYERAKEALRGWRQFDLG